MGGLSRGIQKYRCGGRQVAFWCGHCGCRVPSGSENHWENGRASCPQCGQQLRVKSRNHGRK